jgi:hypothetical protein
MASSNRPTSRSARLSQALSVHRHLHARISGRRSRHAGTFAALKGKHLTRKLVLSHAHVINHRPVLCLHAS